MIHLSLEKFEGPLSLLVKLIEAEELDITQVSLAKVAGDYIEYIKTHALDPEETAEFLVIAAKLLLIKSKSLLPYLEPEEEEELEEFAEQLRMYQEYLAASKKIQDLLGAKKFMFSRPFNRKALLLSSKLFSPPKDYQKNMARAIMAEFIGRLQPLVEKLPEKIIENKVTIEEKILLISQGLNERIRLSFSEVLKNGGDQTEVIVAFLAMLELVRMRQVGAEQGELFGEIELFRLQEEVAGI
jgi:segregation and condensation protein A